MGNRTKYLLYIETDDGCLDKVLFETESVEYYREDKHIIIDRYVKKTGDTRRVIDLDEMNYPFVSDII